MKQKNVFNNEEKTFLKPNLVLQCSAKQGGRELEDLKKLQKVTLKGGQQNFNSQRNPAVPDSPHKSSGRAGERPPYNVQGHKSFCLLPHSSILPSFSLLPHSGLSPVAL